MVVVGQSGCSQAKVVVFRQGVFFSEKIGCILGKAVVFGQSGCIRAKGVVFGQSGSFRAKTVVFGQK